jgi:uncharacterized protein YceK
MKHSLIDKTNQGGFPMLYRLVLSVFLGCIILLSGCSAQRITSYETSGFMGNYAGFVPGAEGQPNLIYLTPNLDLRPYSKILIDHVVVYFNPDSQNKEIAPDQLIQLTEYFHKSLVDALQGRYPIVDQPGPDVLRLRAAITDVESGKPVGNAASTIIPVGAAINIISRSTTGSNIAVGRASVEVELLDSLSGMRLAAAIDRREGGKSVASGTWSAAQEAFDYWTKRLRIFIDKQKAM